MEVIDSFRRKKGRKEVRRKRRKGEEGKINGLDEYVKKERKIEIGMEEKFILSY